MRLLKTCCACIVRSGVLTSSSGRQVAPLRLSSLVADESAFERDGLDRFAGNRRADPRLNAVGVFRRVGQIGRLAAPPAADRPRDGFGQRVFETECQIGRGRSTVAHAT